ncbi:hypothetical protein [Methylobacterium tarhaniae]|uniref:hypothetical protein n=1 Tax=Methylobacterium tarhaniae TaxID=1187852 RepID=UPI00069CFA5F|nr:hypothetical protein [Methylobacterium tarhaniae]
MLTPDAPTAIREPDTARLPVRATDDDGREVPADPVGRVIGVWNQGEAYEVEFATPFDALATVAAEQVIRGMVRPLTLTSSIVIPGSRLRQDPG